MIHFILNRFLSRTAFLLSAMVFYFLGCEFGAQTGQPFQLKVGKTYHVEYLGMQGDFTLVALPSADGWAVVNFEKGFRDANLRSSQSVGLNLNLALIIEELGDADSLKAAEAVNSNKEAIFSELNYLVATAYQYRIRPKSMGGGAGSYLGYTIPSTWTFNENASYQASVTSETVTFTATSTQGHGTVQAVIDQNGRPSGWVYTGKFK